MPKGWEIWYFRQHTTAKLYRGMDLYELYVTMENIHHIKFDHGLDICNNLNHYDSKYVNRQVWANNVDPDQVRVFTICHSICIWAASWQNQQNDFSNQRRLRSAWASALSDQSLCCLHEETLGPQLPIERTVKTDQNGQMLKLIWVFAGCTDHFVGFVMRWFIFWTN